ncbi:MAG: hypothetical protein JRH16_19535 [Deltaproteobacteria bacterium]|nr:hypothetical protein [Deltaproteobacteria bacterium]
MKALRQRGLRCIAAVLVVALASATTALADDGGGDISVGRQIGHAAEISFDVLILRPLGAAATAGGFGCFLIAAPLLAPTQEVPYAWDTFVIGPYQYTAERPLGDF